MERTRRAWALGRGEQPVDVHEHGKKKKKRARVSLSRMHAHSTHPKEWPSDLTEYNVAIAFAYKKNVCRDVTGRVASLSMYALLSWVLLGGERVEMPVGFFFRIESTHKTLRFRILYGGRNPFKNATWNFHTTAKTREQSSAYSGTRNAMSWRNELEIYKSGNKQAA